MFDAHGWICVRSSRDTYDGNVPIERYHEFYERTERADEKLWDLLEEHLASYGVESDEIHTWSDGTQTRPVGLSLIKWSFYRHLNNMSGMLTLVTSRNHRYEDFADLVKWIAEKGPGSYGIIYVRDDEDYPEAYGRGGSEDYSNEFRVWRILNGCVEEFDDPFLSPIVPRIDPPIEY